MLNITILQRTIPGSHHQEAVACFRHEDGHRYRCGVSSLRVRKLRAGCGEHRSLIGSRSDGRMYCLSCKLSCFRTKVKLFEGMGN